MKQSIAKQAVASPPPPPADGYPTGRHAEALAAFLAEIVALAQAAAKAQEERA